MGADRNVLQFGRSTPVGDRAVGKQAEFVRQIPVILVDRAIPVEAQDADSIDVLDQGDLPGEVGCRVTEGKCVVGRDPRIALHSHRVGPSTGAEAAQAGDDKNQHPVHASIPETVSTLSAKDSTSTSMRRARVRSRLLRRASASRGREQIW